MTYPLGTYSSPSPVAAFHSVIFGNKQCYLATYLTYYLYQNSKGSAGKLTKGQVLIQEKGFANPVFTLLWISNFVVVS